MGDAKFVELSHLDSLQTSELFEPQKYLSLNGHFRDQACLISVNKTCLKPVLNSVTDKLLVSSVLTLKNCIIDTTKRNDWAQDRPSWLVQEALQTEIPS